MFSICGFWIEFQEKKGTLVHVGTCQKTKSFLKIHIFLHWNQCKFGFEDNYLFFLFFLQHIVFLFLLFVLLRELDLSSFFFFYVWYFTSSSRQLCRFCLYIVYEVIANVLSNLLVGLGMWKGRQGELSFTWLHSYLFLQTIYFFWHLF